MDLTDTHCHIHEALQAEAAATTSQQKWLKLEDHNPDHIIERAHRADVNRLVVVGTFSADSQLAVDFVENRPGTWASIGIHPHEADQHLAHKHLLDNLSALASRPKVVAVGECGLDYFYEHSSRLSQEKVLRYQIELALENSLPLIFHVRSAFKDFWRIIDEYQTIRGVVHSFTDTQTELNEALARGLFVGLNGIMTFTRDQAQLAMAHAVPLNNLLLETDAPYLTPSPDRGKICEPKYVRTIAEFLVDLRGESLENLAQVTTQNAVKLFSLR